MTDHSKHDARTSASSGPVPHENAPVSGAEPATPPDAPVDETPEVSRGPRTWPRVAAALILVAGAGGAWVWQNPGSVQKSLSAVFPGLSRGDADGERVKALEARLARLEQRPVPAPIDLSPLAARLEALEKRPPVVAPDLRPLTSRLDALEARADAPRPDGTPAFAGPDIRPLITRLDALERHVAATAADPAKVDAISTRVEALSSRDLSAELRARLDELERQLSAQAAKDATVAEVSDRAARLARVEAAAISLAAGRPLGPIPNAPPALARFAAPVAPPTEAALRLAFPSVSREALKVSLPDTAGKPFLDRMMARLQDFRLITVREGDNVLVGNAAVSVLARAHTQLDAGDLSGAAQTVGQLSGPPAGKMAAWLADAKALAAAREALALLAGERLMRRILRTLFWSALALVTAWFIASLPGRTSFDAGPYTVETSTSIAVAVVLAVFAVLYVLLRLITMVVMVPRAGSLWRGGRRRRAGDMAVTRAMVALAAGEKADARREAGRARALLGDTPQTLLLAAEAGRLAGRDDEAVAALRALAERKDSALLGLRGLLANAVAHENWAEATALARQAEAAHPGAAWLRQERAQLAIRAGDWTEAMKLAPPGAPKAALAVGASLNAASPDQAERLTRQALKDDPSFVPAIVAQAGHLRARGQEKKAQALLADGWKRSPHPDIAAVALAPATDKQERARTAQRLTAGAPEHPESRLLLARTALDAGTVTEARRHLDAGQSAGLNHRRAWLLRAEIEEEEHGDTEAGRLAQRDALRRAANADPDPEWRCTSCHTAQPSWHPACPACLAPGTMAWTTAPAREPAGAEIVARAVA